MPEPRDFGWTPKPFSSAETEIKTLPTGQIVLTTLHATIKGVSAEMLAWWFEAFPDLDIVYRGQRMPAYWVWHPVDHIGVQAFRQAEERPVQPGDRLRIHEAFRRKPEWELDATALVTRLDTKGVGLRVTMFGAPVMDLLHSFDDVEGGARYHSRMVLGTATGILKPLINRLVLPRRFDMAKAKAWLEHNVEEVGYFEEFLPALYAKRDAAPVISLD